MSYLRFRDEDESSVAGTVAPILLGALAGFAVGMIVAQRVGGFRGLADKVRRRGIPDAAADSTTPKVADDFADFDEYEDDEIEEQEETSGLEGHVLEAFRNDPILAERAIDIGGIGEETIELAIVREHDMATLIPREAVRIHDRGRQPTYRTGRLQHVKVVIPQRRQLPGASQPTGASADYDNPARRHSPHVSRRRDAQRGVEQSCYDSGVYCRMGSEG